MANIVGTIVRSGYWVAKNIILQKPDVMVSEPIITKLQVFPWHLIWQMVSR